MIAERTKLLNQESRRKAASVQSLTDKMNRLINRKVTLQKPCMVNEYGSAISNTASSGDRAEKVVNNHSNISNSKTKSSAEGKRQLD